MNLYLDELEEATLKAIIYKVIDKVEKNLEDIYTREEFFSELDFYLNKIFGKESKKDGEL